MEKKPAKPPKPLKLLANFFSKSKSKGNNGNGGEVQKEDNGNGEENGIILGQ